MGKLTLKNLTKSYGDLDILKEINLEVTSGEFLVLVGPSGCGKSTTLRLIAGLEEVSSGQIEIDGMNVNNTDPANRNVSMVFQSYALFPHLNVAENIIFGLKVRKVEKNERNARLVKVAEIVGLENLLKRKPSELSGGQRQRVALARAIISDNPICLMDEPLSNLDAKLRHQMRVEIRELQKKIGITMIYVTHDQTEAMSMADKIVLMNEGHIVQQGKPKELFENPSHMFTAKFLGNPPMNIIETEHDGETHFINHNGEKIDFRQDNKKDLVFGLRPEDIKVSDKGIKCNVNFLDYQGSETIINTTLGIHEINIKTDSKKTDNLNQEIYVKWNKKDIKVFEK